MSDVFWSNLPQTILAVATLLGAITSVGAFIVSLWNRKQLKQQDIAASELKGEVVDLKEKVNGQTSALIAVKEDAARAIGVIAGEASGKEQAKVDAAELVDAVAAKMAADQVIRNEGRASGQVRTRHDDPPIDVKKS